MCVCVFEYLSTCECVCMHTEWYSSGICTENLCISLWIQFLIKVAPESSVQSRGDDPGSVGTGWCGRYSGMAWASSQLNSVAD